MYGPDQPADEGHGQDRGDHGQGGEDGRVADFVHGFDGHLARLRPWLCRHAPVAHDVLHDHDRVVHQDADGEDQREQRDAVQREAVEVETASVSASVTGIAMKTISGFAQAERERDQRRSPRPPRSACGTAVRSISRRPSRRSCA